MSDIGFTPDPDGLEELDDLGDVRTASIVWAGEGPPRLFLVNLGSWEAVALLEGAAYELRSQLEVIVEGYEDEDDDDDD